MTSLRFTFVVGLALLASGCAEPAVRQQDLEVWIGVPVAALDKQPLFVTVPMIRTITEDGTEIRSYASGRHFASCAGTGNGFANGPYVSADAFANCLTGWAGCSHVFHVKGGRVLRYAPAGRCYTNESVWPTARFLNPKASGGQS